MLREESGAIAPSRLLIEGPAGYGKTTLALSLGRRLQRPVLRLEAARCLQRDLGSSERLLREMLARASHVPGAILLLDDVDRLFGASGAADGTLTRMDGVFPHWMDRMPSPLTLVMTATNGALLQAQWLHRVQLRLWLNRPDLTDASYRQAVFAAVLRRHGLKNLARDAYLVSALADQTNPYRSAPLTLHSPAALAGGRSALREQTVRLKSGADIEDWVQTTLALCAGVEAVETPDFWLQRLR